jgi:predicted phosphoribosyltransferase
VIGATGATGVAAVVTGAIGAIAFTSFVPGVPATVAPPGSAAAVPGTELVVPGTVAAVVVCVPGTVAAVVAGVPGTAVTTVPGTVGAGAPGSVATVVPGTVVACVPGTVPTVVTGVPGTVVTGVPGTVPTVVVVSGTVVAVPGTVVTGVPGTAVTVVSGDPGTVATVVPGEGGVAGAAATTGVADPTTGVPAGVTGVAPGVTGVAAAVAGAPAVTGVAGTTFVVGVATDGTPVSAVTFVAGATRPVGVGAGAVVTAGVTAVAPSAASVCDACTPTAAGCAGATASPGTVWTTCTGRTKGNCATGTWTGGAGTTRTLGGAGVPRTCARPGGPPRTAAVPTISATARTRHGQRPVRSPSQLQLQRGMPPHARKRRTEAAAAFRLHIVTTMDAPNPFRDRTDAGKRLAASWSKRPHDDVVVLGLTRGGVPVAYEMAQSLGAPLDVIVVRKIGAPGHEELALGAVAPRGVRIFNEDVMSLLGVSAPSAAKLAEREEAEMARRERAYRQDAPSPDLQGRSVVIVDDGLATGASMQAAVESVRRAGAAQITVAVPTGSPESCQEVRRRADDLVCLTVPEPFFAVGQAYEDFGETSDDEVRSLLARAASGSAKAPPNANAKRSEP